MAKKSLEAKKNASLLLISIAAVSLLVIACYCAFYLGAQFGR